MRFHANSVPFVFALVTVAAYGLLLPLTGFYWDDWPFAWIARFQGPSEFIAAFAGFRPFLGPIFFITTSLLPPTPLAWQSIALVVRLLATGAAWYALDQAWPRARGLTLAASMLFLVFPGYSQHWVALTHVNQEWISLIAYLFSIGLSIRALHGSRQATGTKVAALALLVLGLLPTEYFLGLEILRPILFWASLAGATGDLKGKARTAWRAWVPYVIVWLLNAAWLLIYYRSGHYVSYELDAAPGGTALPHLAAVFADAVWKAAFYVWFQIIPLAVAVPKSPTGLMTFGIVVLAAVLLAGYLRRLDLSGDTSGPLPLRTAGPDRQGSDQPQRHQSILAISAGLIGILAGRIPSLAAGLPLTLQSSFDRLMISMMLGACLFIAGVLHLLMPRREVRNLVLALIVALGVGQQFFNANIFRRDWLRQNEIYWQFAWRIPALMPDTAILAHEMPLDYETDLAMTAALNWMYADHVTPPHLPYAVIYVEKRLGGNALPELRPGVHIDLPFRTMRFSGSTSQIIAVHVPARGCLRVFDPDAGDLETYSALPDAVTAAIPLSDTGRILATETSPILPRPPFTQEPVRGWCYYFEKGELARQMGDWTAVRSLRGAATESGLAPDDPIEWLPFIEAEARSGDLKWAAETTRSTISEEPKLQRGLCVVWRRVSEAGTGDGQVSVAGMLSELGCDD